MHSCANLEATKMFFSKKKAQQTVVQPDNELLRSTNKNDQPMKRHRENLS